MAYTENVGCLRIALRLILVACFFFCIPNFVDSSPLNSKKVAEGIDYLTRFGYLVADDPRTGNLRSQQDLEKSIKMLQRYGGLPETGKLDAATIKLMGESRCGVSDFGKTDNTRRKKRYTLQGSRWKKHGLTYKIKSFTPDIRDIEKQRQTFRKAFKLWSDATNLRINEDRYANDKNVDIHISFETGYHSDAYPFDGAGGTLAHAFYPHNNLGLSGDAHFDDGERFTIGTKDGINLDWVAVHEFGHSLGLEHSNVRESIMYPWYKGYKDNIELTYDDIQGIQALYGKPTRPTNPAPATPKPTTTKRPIPEENDVCSMSSYDTFFLGPDKKTYALKGTQYWIISSGSGAGLESGPHRVTDLWKELPNKIDAAYRKSASRLVFFSGAKVWQYYYRSDLDTYYIEYNGPRDFRQYGLPMDLKDMDAAFVWGRNSRTYFFKGDKYWRYNGRKIDYGYPKSTSVWKGLPANINSAMKWRNGRTYFFVGSIYYKFNDWEIQVEADYPKSIALKWMHCEKDNLDMITTSATPGVTQNTTQAYRGCDHVHEKSSGSAAFPSLVTLCSLLLAILKLNF